MSNYKNEDMSEILVFTVEEQAKLDIMFKQWMIADHNRKIGRFKELNKTVQKGGILFVGDSITEGYPIYELIDSDIVMYNRGISGFRASQLLKHIEDQILHLEPTKIFLLIGTNDLVDDGVTPKDISKHIKMICNEIKTKLPKTKIYVLSVYPVNTSEEYKDMVSTRTNIAIESVNKSITKWIDDMPNTKYIDVYHLLKKDGQLNMDYSFDGLHLSIRGYRVISNVLQSYIKKSNH